MFTSFLLGQKSVISLLSKRLFKNVKVPIPEKKMFVFSKVPMACEAQENIFLLNHHTGMLDSLVPVTAKFPPLQSLIRNRASFSSGRLFCQGCLCQATRTCVSETSSLRPPLVAPFCFLFYFTETWVPNSVGLVMGSEGSWGLRANLTWVSWGKAEWLLPNS